MHHQVALPAVRARRPQLLDAFGLEGVTMAKGKDFSGIQEAQPVIQLLSQSIWRRDEQSMRALRQWWVTCGPPRRITLR